MKKYDKRLNTEIGPAERFNRQQLIELYRADGLARRIVEIPAKDMVREWFEIDGDPDGIITDKLGTLKSKKIFKEALFWSRLFGGSVITMLIKDGGL